MADAKPKDVAGCLALILSLFISCPIWLTLNYGILSAVEAPGWMWALYWVYVPVQVCIILITVLVKLIDE